jgi:hypothetical protein
MLKALIAGAERPKSWRSWPSGACGFLLDRLLRHIEHLDDTIAAYDRLIATLTAQDPSSCR